MAGVSKAEKALAAIQEHFASDPANGRNRDFGHDLGVLLGLVEAEPEPDDDDDAEAAE